MSTSSSAFPPSASSTTQPATTSSSSNQLYALASRIPLIKSPSISVPPPVKLPADLHPLPADIAPYFVYNFSLESYVLDANTPSPATIDELLVKHKAYLEERERQKDEQRRELLRRVAPGWSGDVLLPSTSSGKAAVDTAAAVEGGGKERKREEERTPLDDLADHLAQLDALNSQTGDGGGSGSHPHH